MPQKTAMTDGIRNLIFDFGGVLLDIDIRRTVAAFAALGLPGLDPFDTHPRNAVVFLRLELGQITERQFVEQLQALVPDGNPVPAPAQLLDAWNAMLLPYDWRRFELLDRLRAEGRRIFLLSNTNLPHRRCFIDRFDRGNPAGRPFESYFDRCFWSDEMHLRKPAPEIYLDVLREEGLRAPETLFIDDNSPNTDAARELGIRTFHLAPPTAVSDLFG